jgi:hypothetical protein
VASATQPAASDLSDTIAPTAWTPTDQSGASLTLTNNGSYYYKVGKLVVATVDVTYPGSPGSASQAQLSLPATTSSSVNNWQFNGVVQNSGSNPIYWALASNSADGLLLWSSLNLGTVSNNGLAGLRLRFTATFFTS